LPSRPIQPSSWPLTVSRFESLRLNWSRCASLNQPGRHHKFQLFDLRKVSVLWRSASKISGKRYDSWGLVPDSCSFSPQAISWFRQRNRRSGSDDFSSKACLEGDSRRSLPSAYSQFSVRQSDQFLENLLKASKRQILWSTYNWTCLFYPDKYLMGTNNP
jgi:hypothetical protein